MPSATSNPFGDELMPAVSSFVYRDWNVTIREMPDNEPSNPYYEWFLEKNGSHFRDPTTHTSIDAASHFARSAVDSIIQDENDRARRRSKKK